MNSGHATVGRIAALAAGMAIGGAVTAAAVVAIGGPVDARGEPLDAPRFVDETATAGVGHVYSGGFRHFVGGGIAVFDCDSDRFPDLYVAGGTGDAGLYVNHSEQSGPLSFTRIRDPATDLPDVTGAYPLDVDSDGIVDLAVLRIGENVMLRGLGGCRFERANETWGVDGGDSWTAAFSATWEGSQSLPTMVFGNYLEPDETGSTRRCADHQLLRPGGATYAPPVTLSPGWCTLSALFSDWGRNGSPDLRMTNDRHYYRDGAEQLWRVDPGAEPEPYTAAEGWRKMQIWGMGIASHDITGDGLPEIYLTSQGDNKLQTLEPGSGQPAYEDIALAAGVTAHRPYSGDTNRPSTAWHAEFGDVNSDGFVDLFVSKGNVDAMDEFAMDDPNNLLLGAADGTFVESGPEAGVVDHALSRGAAVADLNRDGRLDLVVVERREPVKLWRNTGDPAGNWLEVDIGQPAPNVDAVGSWVEVRTGGKTVRTERTVGGGHAGGELGPLHFGLGRAETADVRVVWPDGETGPWMDVAANQTVIVERGAETATTVSP